MSISFETLVVISRPCMNNSVVAPVRRAKARGSSRDVSGQISPRVVAQRIVRLLTSMITDVWAIVKRMDNMELFR